MLRFITNHRDDKLFKVILIKDDDEVLAWALLIPSSPLTAGGGYLMTEWGRRKCKYGVQLWVKPKYRGKGLGKKLMDRAVKEDPTPFVWPWNEVNANLFRKYKTVMTQDARIVYGRKKV